MSDQLFRFFQLALFNFHIFEFAGFEDLAAFQALHKFGVLFAGNYSNTRVFALGQVVHHRGRVDRRDVIIDSGLLLSRAEPPRADSRRNWLYFYRPRG